MKHTLYDHNIPYNTSLHNTQQPIFTYFEIKFKITRLHHTINQTIFQDNSTIKHQVKDQLCVYIKLYQSLKHLKKFFYPGSLIPPPPSPLLSLSLSQILKGTITRAKWINCGFEEHMVYFILGPKECWELLQYHMYRGINIKHTRRPKIGVEKKQSKGQNVILKPA